jgi:hypothetical protein
MVIDEHQSLAAEMGFKVRPLLIAFRARPGPTQPAIGNGRRLSRALNSSPPPSLPRRSSAPLVHQSAIRRLHLCPAPPRRRRFQRRPADAMEDSEATNTTSTTSTGPASASPLFSFSKPGTSFGFGFGFDAALTPILPPPPPVEVLLSEVLLSHLFPLFFLVIASKVRSLLRCVAGVSGRCRNMGASGDR